MGRGCGWSDEEIGHLERAWLYKSEDAVTGTDQTSRTFKETLFERFKEFAPSVASDKTYGARNVKAVRAKWDEIAADVQKFRFSLRVIKACNPTEVVEDQVISMEIAKHLGKRKAMSYDAKDFSHTEWKNHLAYRALRNHPKFHDLETCLLYTSPSPRDQRGSRMPSSA